MLLTPEERSRFCEWLRQEITSDTALIQQMGKFSIPGMAEARKRELAAKLIVLGIIESTESVTISAPRVKEVERA